MLWQKLLVSRQAGVEKMSRWDGYRQWPALLCYPRVSRAESHRLRILCGWAWGWWRRWSGGRPGASEEGFARCPQAFPPVGCMTTSSPTANRHSPAKTKPMPCYQMSFRLKNEYSNDFFVPFFNETKYSNMKHNKGVFLTSGTSPTC